VPWPATAMLVASLPFGLAGSPVTPSRQLPVGVTPRPQQVAKTPNRHNRMHSEGILNASNEPTFV
jgi:hypothetical protein